MTRTEAFDSLDRSEIEFHRLARTSAIANHERDPQHVPFALRRDDESLLAAVEGVTAAAARSDAERMPANADARDVMAARDSTPRLLGRSTLER